MDLQSYDEVLDFLEVFFQKNILEPKYIQEMNFILDGCRE